MSERHPRKPPRQQVWALTVDGQLSALGETLERAERIIWPQSPPWIVEPWGVHLIVDGRRYQIERWIVQ